MKKIEVSAKAPKAEGKQECTITVNFPETTAEAVELHGEAACVSNLNAAATVKIQSSMRSGLVAAKDVAEIQKALENYKLGMVTRTKKDPVAAMLAQDLTEDATTDLIRKLKAKLAAKKQEGRADQPSS